MESLYGLALMAINRMYGDTPVPIEEAIVNLNSLKDEINILIDVAQDDIKAT